MSENCDAIVIFPIYGQFGAIQKLNSDSLSAKLMFSLIVTFYVIKTENRTKKSWDVLGTSTEFLPNNFKFKFQTYRIYFDRLVKT